MPRDMATPVPTSRSITSPNGYQREMAELCCHALGIVWSAWGRYGGTLLSTRLTQGYDPRTGPHAPWRNFIVHGHTVPTTTISLAAIAAELRASPVPPDPSDLIAVNAVHLALWRFTIANARHAPSSYVAGPATYDIEALHAVLRAAYHLAGGVVVRDRGDQGYYHELALVEALELLRDRDS